MKPEVEKLTPEEIIELGKTVIPTDEYWLPHLVKRIAEKLEAKSRRKDRPELKFNNVLEADAHNWDTRELDRPDREKIAKVIHKAHYESPLAPLHLGWNELCDQSRKRYMVKADQILALMPDVGAIEELRTKLTELEKKLDDREADLIEAKREENERMIAWMEELCDCPKNEYPTQHPPTKRRNCWKCRQARGVSK